MTREDALALLAAVTARWVADPESDVVHAEVVEDRWAVRIRQRVRDYTTVWFDVGTRSVRWEAYVLPAPARQREEVYRQCLVRNAATWRVHFAVDAHGEIVLRGRLALAALSERELEHVLAEIYDLVEVSFPALLRTAFPTREKTP